MTASRCCWRGLEPNLQRLIAGAEQRLLGTSASVVTVTAAIGAVAVWSATRRIALLHVADVQRAETAD